jgi:hypothetical protein
MSTSTKTLTPEQQAALAKLQSFQQQKALDEYLSSRATQYGATPKGGTAWTAGQTLANPFAGLTDLGKKTQFVSQGGGEEAPQEQEVAKTVSDVLGEKFGAQLGHKSTFARAYKKDEKGNPTEVNIDSLTPEELNSGNVVLFMGGATGGKERERMAQAYIPKGDKLIPVGDPTYYKGEHPDAANVANALQIGSILSLPFGGSLFGASNLLTQGLGSFLPEAAAKVAGSALASGIAQGTMSKLTGGSFGKGFGTGAIAGGVGAGLDQFAGDTFKNLGEFAKPAKSLVTSGVTSLLTGQKFDPTTAVQNAAINYGLGKAGEAAGIDPKQQAAMMKFYNFAAPLIAARRKPGGP